MEFKLQQNEGRKVFLFCDDWHFQLGDFEDAISLQYDDSSWQQVTLPHDWSILSGFSNENPTLARGGYVPAGIGWYRKNFKIDKKFQNKKIEIEFEGIYRNATIWVNGEKVGFRPNGYIAQRYDIGKYLNFGGKYNLIAVRVDNSDQPASRYYTGSGIYRDVTLTIRDKVYFENQNPFVTTKCLKDNLALIGIKTDIKCENKLRDCFVEFKLYDNTGFLVSNRKTDAIYLKENDISSFETELEVKEPTLWSTDNPYLYLLRADIVSNNKICDTAIVRVGIRTFEFSPDNGFLLNNVKTEIKGVCLHHDNGCLGAAANVSADKRRLMLMKNMGANAIRLSHNPYSDAPVRAWCGLFPGAVRDRCFSGGMVQLVFASGSGAELRCSVPERGPTAKGSEGCMNMKNMNHKYVRIPNL